MGKPRLISRRRQDQGFKWARITMAVLATIGFIDTASITMQRWGWFGPISCPGGLNGCEKVLNSPWGVLLEINRLVIPTSFFGLLAYLAIFAMAMAPLLPGLSENKTDLSRRTWWGLLIISSGMTAFSFVLIWLMAFKIKAFCLFCILSAILSLVILVLSLISGSWEDLGKVIFRAFIFSFVILLGGFAWAAIIDPNSSSQLSLPNGSPPPVESISSPEKVYLAKHLTATNSIMYSAYWCPHCHDQKELFGKEGAAELKIVECAVDGINNERALCERKGIEGFPTWEINGKLSSGVKSLKELAELSLYQGDTF